MRWPAVAICVVLTCASWAQERGPAGFDELIAEAHEHTRTGRHDEASAALAKALEAARTDEERAMAVFTLAVSHEARGDQRAAVEALAGALELQGDGQWLVRCLQRLGLIAERQQETATARRAWERLVAVLGPDASMAGGALMALARIDRQTGRLSDAAAHLEALLEREVHAAWHHEARESLAAILLTQEAYDEALAVARGIELPERRAGLAMTVANRLLEAGEMTRAMAIAREVLRDTPGHLAAMRLVHRAARDAGTLDQLRRDLRAEAEGNDPEAALTFLAQIARWEDDRQGAMQHLRRLAELRPEDPEAQVRLAEAALEAGERELAQNALRSALRLAPEHQGALMALAEVLVHEGRTDEAIDRLKSAVEYDPGDPGTVRRLDGILRRHSLNHARAKVIEEAREASGEVALMAYELARVYIDLLRYEDAARELLVALGDERAPAHAVGVELERLVGDELAGGDVIAAVRQHVREVSAPSDPQRLVLARVLLAAGDRQGAAELLEGTQGAGMAVADLAREAHLRNDDELAGSLYAMALGMELPGQQRAAVALESARLQREQGAWRAALETLEAIPALEAQPEALLMRAELLTGRARRLEEAFEAWQRLLRSADGDPHYVAAAREGMADWLFASGRFDEAERAYAELAGEDRAFARWDDLPPLPPGLLPDGFDVAAIVNEGSHAPARAALRLAEIALRRGEFQQAEERFRLVAEHHAQSPWANDALERLAFMRENLERPAGAALRYFEALGLRERGEDRMARDLLLEIAGTRGEPLADDAQAVLAEMNEEQGEMQAAADRWLSLVERFPDSLLAPQALLRAAGVLRDELDDTAGAARALRRVAEDYPDSAAAHHARAALELLPPPRS
ncbi:MAG: tetratricopeptide repeat protein [Armatimonadota bacterium]|jgi:tetratricopeptide (TPR) repeat protein